MRARDALLMGALGLSSLSWSVAAAAQDDEESLDEESSDGSGEAEPGGEESESADEAGTDEEEAAGDDDGSAGETDAATAAGNTSPVEVDGETYKFVGLRYRGIIVPKFMMNLFGDGGRTVYVHAFGPEYTTRKDDFEFVFSLWYAGYGMEPTPFKAKDDPDLAWEMVESKVKVLYLTADFLWSHDFSPEVALNYGMGAGLGIVFGDLIREQSYPGPGDDPDDPYGWNVCAREFDPAGGAYCDNDNDHYNGYTEPSWASGGSKPIVFPWFAGQLGVRYKPHKNFQARLDMGFGLSGFFWGLSAAYGL